MWADEGLRVAKQKVERESGEHMKFKMEWRALCATSMLCVSSAYADISGTTFLDYNGNGVMDTTGAAGSAVDAGVGGVSVIAYGVTALGVDGLYGTKDDVVAACGPAVTTSTTLATLGQYTIPLGACLAGTKRVEFSGWPSPLQPGLSGQTTVQFVSTSATAVSLPLINATQFCENNPQLVTSCYVFGNQLSGPNNASDVLVSFPYSAGGTTVATSATPAPAHIAVANQIGSTYGLAFQQSTQRLFAAAYTKFNTGHGPSGPGAIYAIDRANGDAVSTFVDINAAGMTDAARPGLFGPGAAGTDPFGGTDAAVKAAVHMTAWGDIDLSEDGNTLYALNLNNLRVYSIPIVAGAITSSVSISVLPPLPFPASDVSCAAARENQDTYVGLVGPHAIGLGIQGQMLYVGARCQTGPVTDSFYVFRYDLNAGAWDINPALTFPLTALNHTGFTSNKYSGNISDIGFAANGDMILGIRNIASDTQNNGSSVGQILRACKSGTTYILENNAQCGTLTGFSPGNNNGPGDGQYFQTDIAADGQRHSQQGGLAVFPQRDTVVSTSYDQYVLYETNASWYTISSGQNTKDYQVLQAQPPLPTELNNKSNVLGELEAVCRAAPVEIGNRLWRDLNANGIQDPSEPPLAGVTVELRSATNVLLGTAVTDANGQYIFSNDGRGYAVTGNDGSATGGYTEDGQGGTLSTTALRYGTLFKSGDVLNVVIPNAIGGSQQTPLAGLALTSATQGGNTAIDSNFALNANAAQASVIAGAPGVNNHTIDAGFVVPVIDLTVAKTVTSTGPYSVGSTVTFALVATNNGPATAQEQVIVQDCLPVGLTYSSATGSGWTCSNAPGPTVVGALTCTSVVTCTRDAGSGALSAASSAAQITLNTTVASGTSGALVNYTKIAPAANETIAESNLLGTTNSGYESGSAMLDSNNDASASVNVATTFSVGDLVFVDQNNNGFLDGGETPLAGVKVELFAATAGVPSGLALGTVTTDVTGRYRFDGLSAGDYVVVAMPPANYVSSTGTPVTTGNVNSNELDNGIDTVIASGAGVGGFQSLPFTLGPGNTEPVAESNNTATVPSAQIAGVGGEAPDTRSDRTVDFGFYLPFDLRVTKSITSPGPYTAGSSTVTYTILAQNLGPGVASAGIIVKDKLPAGLTATAASGTDWTCTPTTGAAVEIVCTRAATAGALAANASAAIITVTATVDAAANGSLLNSAQVNPSPADAARPELIPLGVSNGGYEDGANATGSNNDDSKSIAVGTATYSLGNRVWNDANNDGTLNAGEVGLGNVTVRLISSTNTVLATTTSDSMGFYQFTGLAAGTYSVEIVPPSGYLSSTGANGGTSGAFETAGNANHTTFSATTGSTDHGVAQAGGAVRSGAITLGEGQPVGEGVDHPGTLTDATPDNRSNRNVDFGLYIPASVGTVVWLDNGSGGGVANDGIKQAGETGIANVTVRLLTSTGAPVLNGAGQPVTTITDANGGYRIGNLNPGAYRVEFQFPAQSVWTPTVNPAGSGTPPTNPSSGGVDAQLNEMNATTRQTPVITLGPGQDNPNLDSGVRSYAATAVQQEIPTLSFWTLLLLSALLGGLAMRNQSARATARHTK